MVSFFPKIYFVLLSKPNMLHLGKQLSFHFLISRNVEDAAVVGASAILEYTAAELIELAGRTTEDSNITGENVRRGYSDDEELTRLLKDYKCPVSSVEQHDALEQWKPLAGSLFQLNIFLLHS